MMKGHRNGALAAAGSVLLLAGCAAHSAPASMVDASRASRLAGELAAAEAAFDAGDDKALAAAVMRIHRPSARPLDTGSEDMLPYSRDRVRGAVPPQRSRGIVQCSGRARVGRYAEYAVVHVSPTNKT